MWGAPQGCNEHKKAFPAFGILAFISKSHLKKKFIVKESQGKGPTWLMQPLVPERPPDTAVPETRLQRISGELEPHRVVGPRARLP